jgi:small-conductance mechanosensitive channel
VNEEEQLREQLKQLKIDDVLLQTVVTLVNLSGRKLTVDDEKDPEQARKGIEAARALLPLLPEEEVQPVKDALAQLQMVYVKETDERSKARSKIWTPPGAGQP